MNTKIILSIIALFTAIIFQQCKPQPVEFDPTEACFIVKNADSAFVNDNIYFENCSSHASRYLWKFGDGTTSGEKNPTHVYAQKGKYNVTLTATGNSTDNKYVDVNINGSTDLNIKVEINNSGGSAMSGATVKLFETLADYNALTNAIAVATTESNGEVTFKRLKAQVYYVDVFKDIAGTTWSNKDLTNTTSILTLDEVNYYQMNVKDVTK